MTVEVGQQVEFQCVTYGWYPTPTVSWTRDGEAVNSSLYNTTSTTDGGYSNSTSVLNFQAVRNTIVECLATVSTLPQPQSSSVFLVVGKKITHFFSLDVSSTTSQALCSSKSEKVQLFCCLVKCP